MSDRTRMEVLDAQVEALDAQAILHAHEPAPVVGLEPEQREQVVVDMALLAMESAGVHGALWHGYYDLCTAALARYPDIFRGIVYYPEPDIPDVEATLGRLREHPGIAGIRLTPAWPPTGENVVRLHAGAYEPCLREAERLGLVLSLFMSGQLPAVPAIVEAHPDLRIMIDHIGMLPPPHIPLVPERLDALSDLLLLAQYDNVAVKFTGVPALSFEPYPFSDLWPATHQILEAFGPERVLWGSDFRRLRRIVPYSQVVDFIKLTDELSEDEKRLILGGALRAWVEWEPPDQATQGRSWPGSDSGPADH